MEEYQVTDGSDLFTDAEDTHEAEEQEPVGGEPAEAEDTHLLSRLNISAKKRV